MSLPTLSRGRPGACSGARRQGCGSTSTSTMRTGRWCSRTRARWGLRARVEAARLVLPFGPFARLAQDEEPERAGSNTGGGGGLGPLKSGPPGQTIARYPNAFSLRVWWYLHRG
jgi:hypothetical protein